MRICRHCEEVFGDKVIKCLFCGRPVEIVPQPRQETSVEHDKKEQKGKEQGKKWKEFSIPVIATIIVAVILFTIPHILNFNKSTEQVTEIKPTKVDALASVHTTASEPASSPAPPNAPIAVINMLNNALALCSSGKCTDPPKAIEYLNEAIKLRPDLAEAYNNRGNAYGDLGQHQRAIEDYNEAIRLNPHYANAYNNRGYTYSDLGQHQQAIEDYNEAIRLKPENTSAYHNRGQAYFIQGNKELGCRDAQKACELGECKLLEDAKSKKDCL